MRLNSYNVELVQQVVPDQMLTCQTCIHCSLELQYFAPTATPQEITSLLAMDAAFIQIRGTGWRSGMQAMSLNRAIHPNLHAKICQENVSFTMYMNRCIVI